MRLRCPFLLSISCFAISVQVAAQASFSISTDSVVVAKPNDSFVMYDYTILQNLTGDTLPMRWVRTHVLVQQAGGNELGDWVLGVDDPSSWHQSANKIDSADFVLMPTASTEDKLILQLYPNHVPGHLFVHFRVFPIANPADSVGVDYDFTSLETTSASIDAVAAGLGLDIFPNPASNWVNLRNHSMDQLFITFVSPIGQRLDEIGLLPNETKRIGLDGKPAGLWQLVVHNAQTVRTLPLLIAK